MDNNQVQAWCELNDPKKHILLRKSNPIGASTSDLFGTELAQPAVVGATILGNTEYQQREAKLKEVLKNRNPTSLNDDEYQLALSEFQNNPLTGCTSVLDMARVASGYDPNGSATDTQNIAKFNDYLRRVLTAPFFHLTMNEHSEYHREESNWTAAINEISNLFDGVQGEDKSKIVSSITNLANAVASHKDTRQTSNLFTVSAINAPNNNSIIEVYLYSSKIEMIESEYKGSDCKQTDIDIRKINLRFNKEMWKSYARKVLERHVKLVDDWLDDNSTRPGTETVNLCVGPYKS